MQVKKRSKTKVGAVLIGIGAVLGTIGGYLSGNIALTQTIQALVTEVGVVLLAFGVRDWNIINGIKSK